MRIPLLIAIVAIVAAPLGAQTSGDVACNPRRVLTRSCGLPLARRAGTLRLPPSASIGPLGKNPEGKEIVLEDSTVIEVWVTESPASAGMATDGSNVASRWRADTVVAGHRAELAALKIRSPRTGGWHYVGSASITVDSARAVNVLVHTDTPESCDAILRSLVAEWKAPGPVRRGAH